jgi:hypothetical protein
MIQRSDNGLIRTDQNGNTYTRETFEEQLPLFYTRQLLVAGTMPDTIHGVAMDMHDLSRARSFFRYTPADKNSPQPGLYPLFESESGRATLEMPNDFFRITWRIEFIDADSNEIDEEKSRLFSAALYHKGFDFPARQIAGIPTTRKSCEEGYFIIDSKNQLFHLKMASGEPYVHQIKTPDGLRFQHIACVDLKSKSHYAYLFSEDNHIYILTQDEYKLIEWPIESFNANSSEMKIFGDIFNYQVAVQNEGALNVVVLNNEFKKVNEYNETWLKRGERIEGQIFASLFPFQLSLGGKTTRFKNMFLNWSTGLYWLLTNILLVILHLFIIRGKNLKGHLLDLGFIATTGIFGILAVNIFPNKFYK